MKQFILLIGMLVYGSVSSLLWTPFVGVAFYYFFAVLRPQYLWKFQLTGYPAMAWSFYVAAPAILSYVMWSIGLLSFGGKSNAVLRFSPMFTWPHKLMMMFCFWIFLSYANSNNMDRSELWFGEYLKIFAMYYLAARVVRTPNQLWLLYMLLTFALIYIAYEANMIYVSTGKVKLYKDGYAGLDNNGVGLMLALGVPLCYFAWDMTRGWYRWAYPVAAVGIIHAVLTTYSRGAMVSMLVAAPFYLFFTYRLKSLLCFYVIIGGLVTIMAGPEIVARFSTMNQEEQDESFNSRKLSWSIAIDIANAYPWVGAGIRCSALEMKDRGADMENRTIHMQYLQLAADSGWIALILYLATIIVTYITILRTVVRLWRRKDPDAKRAMGMLGGTFCALLSFNFGAIFLSLEVFEVSYLLMLMGAQVWAMLNATDTAQSEFAPPRQMYSGRMPLPSPVTRAAPPTRRTSVAGPHSGPFRRFQPLPPNGPLGGGS